MKEYMIAHQLQNFCKKKSHMGRRRMGYVHERQGKLEKRMGGSQKG